MKARTTKPILSVFATLVVISILILSAPARAVELSASVPSTGNVDSSVNMTLTLTIDTAENVPFTEGSLALSGSNGTTVCRFQPDGSPISGCDGLTISLSSDSSQQLNSANRFGNGWNGTAFENTTFGYGTGFAGNGTPVTLVYNVAWNTTGVLPGTYGVDFNMTADGNSVHRVYVMQNTQSITLSSAASVVLSIKPPYPLANNYVFLCTPSGFNATSFNWNFGDGSFLNGIHNDNVFHTFTIPGAHLVTCTANGDGQNITASLNINASVPPAPVSNLYIKKGFPLGNNYVLVCNTTVTNALFNWTFGDGQKLLGIKNNNTFHTYQPGNHTATCTAYNSTSSSTASLVINTTGGSASSATLTKKKYPSSPNAVFVCNSTLTGVVKYDWFFGDGQKQLASSNQNVYHHYNALGSYGVTCTAKNTVTSQTAFGTFTI